MHAWRVQHRILNHTLIYTPTILLWMTNSNNILYSLFQINLAQISSTTAMSLSPALCISCDHCAHESTFAYCVGGYTDKEIITRIRTYAYVRILIADNIRHFFEVAAAKHAWCVQQFKAHNLIVQEQIHHFYYIQVLHLFIIFERSRKSKTFLELRQ